MSNAVPFSSKALTFLAMLQDLGGTVGAAQRRALADVPLNGSHGGYGGTDGGGGGGGGRRHRRDACFASGYGRRAQSLSPVAMLRANPAADRKPWHTVAHGGNARARAISARTSIGRSTAF